MSIEIVRPTDDNRKQVEKLFETTITDTFKREGIFESHQTDLKKEIEDQKKTLQRDFDSNGTDEYFLLAKIDEKIVGTAAFGSVNEIIRENLKLDDFNIKGVNSVYVHPQYQRQGVGKLLFKEILSKLDKLGYYEFCLDSGYTTAFSYWKLKLGEPALILRNYWGKGAHHMIWHCKLEKILEK